MFYNCIELLQYSVVNITHLFDFFLGLFFSVSLILISSFFVAVSLRAKLLQPLAQKLFVMFVIFNLNLSRDANSSRFGDSHFFHAVLGDVNHANTKSFVFFFFLEEKGGLYGDGMNQAFLFQSCPKDLTVFIQLLLVLHLGTLALYTIGVQFYVNMGNGKFGP